MLAAQLPALGERAGFSSGPPFAVGGGPGHLKSREIHAYVAVPAPNVDVSVLSPSANPNSALAMGQAKALPPATNAKQEQDCYKALRTCLALQLHFHLTWELIY